MKGDGRSGQAKRPRLIGVGLGRKPNHSPGPEAPSLTIGREEFRDEDVSRG